MREGSSITVSKKLLRGIVLCLIIVSVLFVNRIRGAEQFTNNVTLNASGKIKVHFIDVGQADCILIQSNSQNMLIDAGNNDDGELVVRYLHDNGVTKLDYVIGTHAHEDHIGSLDTVIQYFEIGILFLPDQTYETKSYADVLEMADVNQVRIVHPQFKDTYALGEARFIFIMPNADREYTDLNDSSLGIRISNGKHSFLLCGDASKEMEREFIDSKVFLKSDVLKLNHHGSSDANCKDFLKAVDPRFAVITCGVDNDYGHPHKSVMKRLRKLDIDVFRTDMSGTVIFTSDGDGLICNVSPTEE